MRKFLVTIPLDYTKFSMLDIHSFNANVKIKMDESITVHLDEICAYANQDVKEEHNIAVIISCDGEQFKITVKYIYADTEKYAFEIADCIAYKICKNLSYLAQLHNADTHYFHVKFYYYTRNIKILEKKIFNVNKGNSSNKVKQIIINDNISIKEHVNMTKEQYLSNDAFQEIFQKAKSNSGINLMLNFFYKALGDIDPSSQYYNLFTIIEYIENNDKKFAQAIQLVKKDECDVLIDSLKANINNLWLDDSSDKRNEYTKRLISIISQDLQRMTNLTRAEKIAAIINNGYKIYYIKEPLFQFEITPVKMKEFIDLRNKLFHGAKTDQCDSKKIQRLSNELMVLCQKIMAKIIFGDGV
ncbi:hypothetical protein [uncultured Selenomonas sp.]|jgi:hypothetical protein|uniref:hypothetical protein n=1 Tax=uncultured Selenomonas sp. TaxID=159275 RepID=UPI0028E1CAFE|nr:hypothetical protein [uncultured Selenomonas sp.]